MNCPKCRSEFLIEELASTDEGMIRVGRCVICGWTASARTRSQAPSMEAIRSYKRRKSDNDIAPRRCAFPGCGNSPPGKSAAFCVLHSRKKNVNLDEVIADLKLGIKSKAIQEKYGLSKTAVYRIRNGLSLTGSRRDLVLRMARNGSTVSEISERFHCFTAAIKEVLNVDH